MVTPGPGQTLFQLQLIDHKCPDRKISLKKTAKRDFIQELQCEWARVFLSVFCLSFVFSLYGLCFSGSIALIDPVVITTFFFF